jgi:hypothetical protein
MVKTIKELTMKNGLFLLSLLVVLLQCKKTTSQDPPVSTDVVPYAAVPVSKTVNKKVFVHLMPWFETKTTNGGSWGIHWRMNTRNPDIIESNGQRQIATHYYPLIGPYASGDTTVIEYQLLLMKLSGIDGLFIDWPGVQTAFDYPLMVKNTERVIGMLDRVGLKFAIVYEDQNLNHTGVQDKTGTAQNDMRYLENNYFSKSSYEKVEGKPMLLVFGPQALTTPSQWTSVFSVLTTPPSFFPLWFESGEAGANARGEFAWIPQNHLSTLNSFYSNGYTGMKLGSAYPGFHSYYAEGGWNGPTWIIPHNGTSTFLQTLDLALAQPVPYVQLATWNDYGEGTMIEPTKEFGYGFLTSLQQRLGVSNLNQSDLEAVAKMYELRKSKAAVPAVQKKLNQVFYYIVSLQMEKAKELLNTL